MVTRTLVALAVAGALAAPAAAQAAPAISLDRTCYVGGKPIKVTGSGFTANATVTLTGGASGQGTAGADGMFTTQVAAPTLSGNGIAPKIFTLNAQEPQNPANTASVQFPVIRGFFLTNAPISGKPTAKTTWRFAGFAPNQPIWGHFRLKGRTERNYRFGTATGPCGTAVVRARRVPVRKLRAGIWTLVLDQSAHYNKANPHRSVRFQIFKTFQ